MNVGNSKLPREQSSSTCWNSRIFSGNVTGNTSKSSLNNKEMYIMKRSPKIGHFLEIVCQRMHFSAFSPHGSPLDIFIDLRVDIRWLDCVRPHNQKYLEKKEESFISEMVFKKFGIFFLMFS